MMKGLKFLFAAMVVATPALHAQTPSRTLAAPMAVLQAGSFVPLEGAIPAEDVTSALVGRDVTIVGTVQRVKPSSGDRSPTQLLLVNRASSPVMLVFWPEMKQQLGGIKEGDVVSATGKLDDYRGSLQIRIKSESQIRFASGASAAPATSAPTTQPAQPAPAQPTEPQRPVSARNDDNPWGATASTTTGTEGAAPAVETTDASYMTVSQLLKKKELIGNDVSVRGTVSSFRDAWSPTAPNIILLADGTETIEAVFWTTDEVIPAEYKQTGTQVYVTGQFQDYREKLQVRAGNLKNISLQPQAPERIAAAPRAVAETRSASSGWQSATRSEQPLPDPFSPKPVTADGMVTARDLGRDLLGREVTVKGRVVRIAPVKGGKMIVLHDQTGLVMVALRQALIQGTDADGIRIDDVVTVRGTVRGDDGGGQIWVNLDNPEGFRFSL